MRENFRPSLASRTTIHLGGHAIAELMPESIEDLNCLALRVGRLGGMPYVLGQGSNILAEDGELPLVLVRPGFYCGPTVVGEKNERMLVSCGAGLTLRRLLRFCLAQGLSGLEGLAGIPGSVGGAVAMNAGSFGVCVGDCLDSVRVWSARGLHVFSRQSLEFGYRHFSIPNLDAGHMIVEATFALTPEQRSVIFRKTRHDFILKKSRQPLQSASAGCIFKNPSATVSAGRLLEDAGFRGKQLGGMAFSQKHANFLINCGNGTSAEAFALIAEAQYVVKERFGFELCPEVRFVRCL